MKTNVLKTKKVLMALLAMLMPILASAQTKVEIDGIWYNLVTKAKVAEVTFKGESYSAYENEYSGDINIPSTVFHEDVEYDVTSIGEHAFTWCRLITAITIPESVTSIGGSAFHSCESLTSITIPESVTSIGGSAFTGCKRITAITIPNGVTSIGSYTFWNCSSLTTITIPEGVTSIESCAFDDCSSLTTITIPEGVTSIESYTFSGCESLTAINIPKGVTSIGKSAFDGCSSLTAITIPEAVTSIGSYTFSGCSSLTAITLPKGVTSIGERAFYNCSSLTAISLPEGVTSIGERAFYNCSSLTAITIPEAVTSIGSYTFSGCRNLESITIPESVTSIGYRAFDGCSSLTTIVFPKNLKKLEGCAFANCSELLDVYCYAETRPTTNSDAFNGSFPEYATLHVPESAVASYKTTTPWSSFGTIVALGAAITRITLDYTAATLTEGEELKLTTTTTPDNADKNLISWSSSNPCIASVDNTGKVTAIASGTATITATANDGSGVSASCEVTVKELILGKCATPSINYVDGKVSLTCETEGAKVITTVANGDDETFEVLDFDLIPTHTITAYATKSKYENSDEVTLTICWVPCTEEHESEDTGILTIPSKPVLIQSQGGTITLGGLADDTGVAAYDLAGNPLDATTATGGAATLTTNLTKGDIVIVKIGNNSIKIAIK